MFQRDGISFEAHGYWLGGEPDLEDAISLAHGLVHQENKRASQSPAHHGHIPISARLPGQPSLPCRLTTLWLVNPFRRGRISGKRRRRTNRPPRKFAATVRAFPTQHGRYTLRAERTLEGADHRVRRFRRQVLVTAFAVGSELQHWGVLSSVAHHVDK